MTADEAFGSSSTTKIIQKSVHRAAEITITCYSYLRASMTSIFDALFAG